MSDVREIVHEYLVAHGYDGLTIEAHDDSWRTRLLTIADSFERELGCRNGR